MSVWLLVSCLAWGGAQEDYEAGIAALRAGEDVAAADHFVAALAAGGQDPAVYHALGNALHRQDRLGEAMAAWRRGLRLRPGSADIAANLERAQALTRDRLAPPAPAVGPFFWQRWMSARASGILASLAATVGMAMLFGAAAGRRKRWHLALLPLTLAVLLTASTWQAQQSDRTATIIVAEVAAQSTPAEGGVTLFVLHEGAEVRIVEQSAGGISLVALSDGRKGWLPETALRSTLPSDPFPVSRPQAVTEE